MRFTKALLLLCVAHVFADVPIGVLGGTGSDAPTGYLVQPNGMLTTLSGFPANGIFNSVAITASGSSIIGGVSLVDRVSSPVVYLVSPEGTLTPITGLPAFGGINSVAINSSGASIIGGAHDSNVPLAYLVSPSGMLTPISGFPAHGVVNSVAIASSGAGLIGGEALPSPKPPLAFLVSPSGVLTPISGLPASGVIRSVALRDNGSGIIGGESFVGSSPPLAFFVAPDGMLTALMGAGFPQATAVIDSVAIANSGLGIMGGIALVGTNIPPVAYLIASDGTLTALSSFDFPNSGEIFSVAINNNGNGIIGGESYEGSEPPLAYLVSSDGTLMPLTGAGFPQDNGYIDSVAIADSGVALMAGQGPISPVAYLVAPDGTLTFLSGVGSPSVSGFITSVAIANGGFVPPIVQNLTPKSFGPYGSLTNTLFSLDHLFESHCVGRKKLFGKTSRPMATLTADSGIHPSSKSVELTAAVDVRTPPVKKEKRPSWTEWTSFFGDYAYQGAQQNIPAYSNEIAGALAALEYDGMRNVTIGAGLAYALTYVHYANSLGHGRINQEYALAYAEFTKRHFYFNAALWGALYQMHNKRHTLGVITSVSSPHGWLLSPHVELSAPFTFSGKRHYLSLDPFVMFDWANSWQKSFREHGESGFNIVLNRQYSSLLRSEAGLRIYETLEYAWGSFKIEEKASYVNKAPFHTGVGSAIFVGALSSFSIETFSSSMQNLGVAQIAFYFTPWNIKYPHGTLDYQGEFGSSFQSHMLLLSIDQAF